MKDKWLPKLRSIFAVGGTLIILVTGALFFYPHYVNNPLFAYILQQPATNSKQTNQKMDALMSALIAATAGYSGSGNDTSSVTLTMNDTHGSLTLAVGQSVILSWTSQNVKSCHYTASRSGSVYDSQNFSTSGSANSGPLPASLVGQIVYQMVCATPSGGTASDSGILNIVATSSSPTPVSVSVTLNGTSGALTAEVGQTVAVGWTSQGAASCYYTASGAATDSAGVSTSGSTNVSLVSSMVGQIVYQVTCTTPSGYSVSGSAALNVTTPAPPPSPPPPTPSTSSQRIVPTGDVTINVAPTGSNVSSCGSVSSPCQTPQYAADLLYANYDFQCKYKPTIQLAAAPPGQYYFYPGLNISGRLVGQCGTLKPLKVAPGKPDFVIGKYIPFTLRGDPNNPTGAFINPGRDGRPSGACISLSDGAALKVEGVACDTALAAQDGFDIFNGSFMDMSNVTFGNAGYPGTTYSNHISVGMGSTLMITGSYTISGSAWAHINVGANSLADYENNGDPGYARCRHVAAVFAAIIGPHGWKKA